MARITSASAQNVKNGSSDRTDIAKLTCRHITHASDFQALREHWRDLFSDCSYPSIFATWEFASIWWRHFGSHASPSKKKLKLSIITVAQADGRLIAIAPFYFEPNMGNLLQPRRLRLMGQPGRSNYMTEEPIILLRRGFGSISFDAILSCLLAPEAPARWDMVHMKVISNPSAPLLDESALATRLKGRVWEYTSSTGPQLVNLPATWQDLRSRLSKSMRDNLGYYGRRLTRKGHAWKVRIVRDPLDMRDAADHLHRLHAMRSASTRGVYHYNHMPEVAQLWFLQQIMSTLARKGMALIALLEIDGGIVIGAQAFFEHTNCITVYYSGYDPAFYEFSPVFVLEEAVLKDAIARGVESVNFLPDEAAWKARWGSKSELLVEELVCSSTTPLGLTHAVGRRLYNKKTVSSDSSNSSA